MTKYRFSLPTNKEFYHTYKTLLSALFWIALIAQIISGITEIGIIYNIVYQKISFLFWPLVAVILSGIAAILGTLLIEVGLRFLLPMSVKAFLYLRFRGLHGIMSFFILSSTACLLAMSFLLSGEGIEKAITDLSEAPEVLSIDNPAAHRDGAIIRANQTYQEDSARIVAPYDTKIKSLESKQASKVNTINAEIAKYQTRQAREGRSYHSQISKREIKITEIQAAFADSIDKVQSSKSLELLSVQRIAASAKAKAENDFIRAKVAIDSTNISNELVASNELERNTKGGWYFIAIILFVLFVYVVLNEVYQKGSGVEKKYQDSPYDGLPPVTIERLENWKERVQQKIWSKTFTYASKTPQAPTPALPPTLFDYSGVEQITIPVSVKGLEQLKKLQMLLDAPTIEGAVINPDQPGTVTGTVLANLENAATLLLKRAKELENTGLVEEAKAVRLEADQVIKAYLGAASTPQAVADLRGKIIGFLDGKNDNPFALHHRRQIGFDLSPTNAPVSGTAKKTVPDASVRMAKVGDIVPCQNCGNDMKLTTITKKYCSEKCRKAFHAKKHDGKEYDPNYRFKKDKE